VAAFLVRSGSPPRPRFFFFFGGGTSFFFCIPFVFSLFPFPSRFPLLSPYLPGMFPSLLRFLYFKWVFLMPFLLRMFEGPCSCFASCRRTLVFFSLRPKQGSRSPRLLDLYPFSRGLFPDPPLLSVAVFFFIRRLPLAPPFPVLGSSSLPSFYRVLFESESPLPSVFPFCFYFFVWFTSSMWFSKIFLLLSSTFVYSPRSPVQTLLFIFL